MIYQLNNQQDLANAIFQISTDSTIGQLNVSDFQWFITTIGEAINKKLLIDLRYDTLTGLDEHHGTIESAELFYDSNNVNSSSLTLKFNNKTLNKLETLTFNFNAELIEENKNSVPGNFMKYYINDDNHRVIVGIIAHYK